MGWLFKSRKQREREARKDRRRAFREADSCITQVDQQLARIQKDGEAAWEKAKAAAQAGKAAEKQRHLTAYRRSQTLLVRLEQKKWVFQQFRTKMELCKTDQDFAYALTSLNKVINIDTDKVEDVIEATRDILGQQDEAEQIWNMEYNMEMADADSLLSDQVPSIDDLEAQLDAEAASGIGEAGREIDATLEERVKDGEDRIRKLLDDE